LQNIAFIFPDELTAKDIAIRKLNTNDSSSVSSGVEVSSDNNDNNCKTDVSVDGDVNHSVMISIITSSIYHTYIWYKGRRLWFAVREEVVVAVINFLNVRFNVEKYNILLFQEYTVAGSFDSRIIIDPCHPLIELISGKYSAAKYSSSACGR
jgi:hypothetical protein